MLGQLLNATGPVRSFLPGSGIGGMAMQSDSPLDPSNLLLRLMTRTPVKSSPFGGGKLGRLGSAGGLQSFLGLLPQLMGR